MREIRENRAGVLEIGRANGVGASAVADWQDQARGTGRPRFYSWRPMRCGREAWSSRRRFPDSSRLLCLRFSSALRFGGSLSSVRNAGLAGWL